MKKKMRRKLIGIMNDTGKAVWELPDGTKVIGKECVDMRYPPKKDQPR